MNKITSSEIQTLQDYELARPDFRRRVIEAKRRRRVAVGPLVTLVFENRDTVRFQIQEMLRAERIVEPRKVQDEIDVYNTLLPERGEIAATLFIEVTEESKVKPILDSFIGLDEGRSLWLEADGRRFFASFEAGHGREDKISAVHYIRFPLGTVGREALERASRERRPVAIVLSHGPHSGRTELSPETLSEVVADLSS